MKTKRIWELYILFALMMALIGIVNLMGNSETIIDGTGIEIEICSKCPPNVQLNQLRFAIDGASRTDPNCLQFCPGHTDPNILVFGDDFDSWLLSGNEKTPAERDNIKRNKKIDFLNKYPEYASFFPGHTEPNEASAIRFIYDSDDDYADYAFAYDSNNPNAHFEITSVEWIDPNEQEMTYGGDWQNCPASEPNDWIEINGAEVINGLWTCEYCDAQFKDCEETALHSCLKYTIIDPLADIKERLDSIEQRLKALEKKHIEYPADVINIINPDFVWIPEIICK